MAFLRLKKRFEFLTVSKRGSYTPRRSLVMQLFVHHRGNTDSPPLLRFGFTASKKVGNAVRRNRCKRRLRALINQKLPLLEKKLKKSTDIVLIARTGTFDLPFSVLEEDFESALAQLERALR